MGLMPPDLRGHRVYLDSNVFIYGAEASVIYPQIQPKLFTAASQGDLLMVTSALTLAEVLVRPIRAKDYSLEMYYRQILTHSLSLRVIPAGRGIAALAAEVRARHNLKLPDAIHIATSIDEACTYVVTADADWARAGVNVIHPANL